MFRLSKLLEKLEDKSEAKFKSWLARNKAKLPMRVPAVIIGWYFYGMFLNSLRLGIASTFHSGENEVKCLALFKGHKPALLYKMTPEELPDYAGLTTCRVIDYIPEWRRKEAETAPQKKAPVQKEPSNIPKPPNNGKQPDRGEQTPACDPAAEDEIGMVECTVESIRGL